MTGPLFSIRLNALIAFDAAACAGSRLSAALSNVKNCILDAELRKARKEAQDALEIMWERD